MAPDYKPLRVQRHIAFIGETGAGKSSVINLLLKPETNTIAPVSNNSQPCTQASISYKTSLNSTRQYNLWDTRGLGEGGSFLRNLFRGSSERNLKRFLKERHSRQEIDLLVFCIRGSRATEAGRDCYKRFCTITRRLAAPVIVVVTHLEKEKDMEDWWSRNSSRLKELEMEFDDHVCLTALQGHRRLDESRAKLIEVITRNRHWEPESSGFYFGSPVTKPTTSAPPRKGRGFSRVFGSSNRNNVDNERLDRPSIRRPPSSAPSVASTSFYTANTPGGSTLPPSPVVEPPTPRATTIPSKVPHINTNPTLLRASDRPQPPSERTSSGSSLQTMFNHSSVSSCTVYSDVYLESCTEENEVSRSKLLYKVSTVTVVRKRWGWATRVGAFGDVWECDLIAPGKSSRMVAVKALRVNTNGGEELKSHEKKLRRELKIWGKLRHRNIVPLLGVVSGFGPLPSTVSPWFCNGSLSCYLTRHRALESEKKCHLLRDVAMGLRYLHSQGVIHGDLHSDNVLIDDDGTACITDFGLSFISDFVGTSYLKSSICGGVSFADPALVQRAYTLRENVFYPTEACDIYSFGGLMLHVLSGKKPYEGIPSPALIVTVMNGERPQIPIQDEQLGITPRYESLIRMCWDPDENRRPPAHELVKQFDRQELDHIP